MKRGLRAVRGAGRLALKVAQTVPAEWRARVQSLPIDPDLVLYEAFAGAGMLCNPEAIFRTLLEDPEEQRLRHVWVIRDRDVRRAARQEFANEPRVRFVAYGSPAYEKALSTAGLLINNATFPSWFNKRPGQTYLNTWHGTPLKKMGYHEAQGAVGARNVLRNFLMADYLLSTSPFMSEVMYEDAYRLVNIAPGRLVEEGYPRTDRQFLDAAASADVRAALRNGGVSLGLDDKVVLYAPTWKGESFHSPLNDARRISDTADALQALLPAGYRVLVKMHQSVSRHADREPGLAGRLVPAQIPTNLVLGVTDVLVTDYSSIFFDFLSTGRPILFYVPDSRDYAGYRGWYLDPDQRPGPVVDTIDELAKLVAAAGTGEARDPLETHAAAHALARERFAPWDDGGAARRVVDVIRGRQVESRRVRPVRRDGRPTVLVYLGGMTSNGITSSALSLVRHLDHDRFDVSVMYDRRTDADRLKNMGLIDPRARQLIRLGGMTMSKRDFLRRRRLFSGAAAKLSVAELARVDDVLQREWQRSVGSASFDQVIDFSGYSAMWAFLLSVAPAGSRSIWLHNDLAADQRREVEGKNPHHANLAGVFTAYARYDHMVSVSEALREVNVAQLSRWAPKDRFVTARNTVDAERINTMASFPPPSGLVPRTEGTVFVTVGRLSPEKNHMRLLAAFAEVHGVAPDSRLVIVGDGPLREQLERRTDALGISDAVVLTGHQDNPWAILARCDCFVLSSDYEGQPMVILEARVLGLPIVTTSFGSVRSAVAQGQGLVVARSVAALADGMLAASRGDVPTGHFDVAAYNREAVDEFLQATGLALLST